MPLHVVAASPMDTALLSGAAHHDTAGGRTAARRQHAALDRDAVAEAGRGTADAQRRHQSFAAVAAGRAAVGHACVRRHGADARGGGTVPAGGTRRPRWAFRTLLTAWPRRSLAQVASTQCESRRSQHNQSPKTHLSTPLIVSPRQRAESAIDRAGEALTVTFRPEDTSSAYWLCQDRDRNVAMAQDEGHGRAGGSAQVLALLFVRQVGGAPCPGAAKMKEPRTRPCSGLPSASELPTSRKLGNDGA